MEEDTVSRRLYPPIVEVKKLVGKCCFNGSLFAKCLMKGCSKPVYTNFISKDVVSCRIFFVYRSTPSVSEGFKSSIHITRVSLKTGRADLTTNTVLFKDLQNEDPRVLCYNDKVFITFSNVINRVPIHIEINGIYLDEDLKMVRNDNESSESIVNLPINKLARTQKNWTFFKELDIVHILYNIMPFEVYLWNEGDECIPLLSRSWQHPTKPNLRLRGGTPPIKVDGLYYAFVHSTDYEVYCIIFHPSTFQLIQVSRDPILKNRGKKKDIHFPCGVLWNDFESKFYVSLGIDDVKLCFFSIDKKCLDDQLINVERSPTENELVTSFNDKKYVWINSWGGGSDLSLVSFLQSRNVQCRNAVWDQAGCHFPYYIQVPARTVYLAQHPLVSIAKMIISRTQKCNLLKLSDTNNVPFSLTSLIYFMSKQFEEWVECKRDDVFVTRYGSSGVDLDLVCDWLELAKHPEHDTSIKGARAPSISGLDLERLRNLISEEGQLGITLLEKLESKFLQRFPDCL